jgi:peptidoglycan/xylan/chitin deacetylase (PgdA/CDA1 family)
MNLRLDRLVTLCVARPLRRQLRISSQRIPVLMYHSISETSEQDKHPYYRTVTSPDVFAKHMAYLHENGYLTISPAQAADLLAHGIALTSPRLAVITFDDAFADFYWNAFPVLRQHGFTATVYLPTAFIKEQRSSFKLKECMTWTEIRELLNSGISFGSHTVTHPQLYELPGHLVKEEVEVSKQTIEQHLGCSVDSFAYPFAFPDADPKFKKSLRKILGRAGYSNGVCTSIGTARPSDDRFFIRRIPVNTCDDLVLFEAKLAGAYDWLSQPQYFIKLAKRCKWNGSAEARQAATHG